MDTATRKQWCGYSQGRGSRLKWYTNVAGYTSGVLDGNTNAGGNDLLAMKLAAPYFPTPDIKANGSDSPIMIT